MDTLQPVTDFDALARSPHCETETADLSGGGAVVLFTVPAKKMWRLRSVMKPTTGGTVYMSVRDVGSGVAHSIAAGATAQVRLLPGDLDFDMREGWTIEAADGNGTDGARAFTCYYIEEDEY